MFACFRLEAHALNSVNAYWRTLWNKLRSRSINRAIVASVLIHLLVLTVFELGHQLGWWKMSVWKEVTQHLDLLQNEQAQSTQNAQLLKPENSDEPVQLTFVEVDPRSSTPETPDKAKYYSSASSRAANPNPIKTEAATPRIEGTQSKVPKTVEVTKQEPQPLRPSNTSNLDSPAPRPAELQPKPQSLQPEIEPGDFGANKLNPKPLQPKPEQSHQPPNSGQRVRTLAEAKANKGIIEGPAMRQDGGVSRASLEASFDVKGSPFGAYDAAFIAAVQARWYTLLDQRNIVRNQTGKVVVDFQLNKDGRILEVNVSENELNETLAWICQRAILDPAPYAAFPSDLKRLLKSDIREVRFTFFYN